MEIKKKILSLFIFKYFFSLTISVYITSRGLSATLFLIQTSFLFSFLFFSHDKCHRTRTSSSSSSSSATSTYSHDYPFEQQRHRQTNNTNKVYANSPLLLLRMTSSWTRSNSFAGINVHLMSTTGLLVTAEQNRHSC